NQPPILHPYHDVLLPISEVYSSACRCGANVYAKHVLRRQPPLDSRALHGRLIHRLWSQFHSLLKGHILREMNSPQDLWHKLMAERSRLSTSWANEVSRVQATTVNNTPETNCFDGYFEAVWVPMCFEACAELSRLLAINSRAEPETVISWLAPAVTEFPVDGSLVGFSDICRVDAFTPFSLIVEVKASHPSEAHKAALAAYALSIESTYEVPVDVGLLMYVSIPDGRPVAVVRHVLVPLDDKLREVAVEERDCKTRIVAERTHPDIEECREDCVFRRVCEVA
ncbi:MAG: type I-A CRISPR-associated protein Cas4/Csa1, partial [Nitrososphaerota archaeon]